MSVSRETGSNSPTADVSRETGARKPLSAALIAVLSAPIRLYQRLISPLLPARCRYYPSCSSYAVEAVRELGPLRGTIAAAWRLARCNPWSNGGLDPLSERTLFRDAHCGHNHSPQTRNGAAV